MKTIKLLIAIALFSVIVVSCKETEKKEAADAVKTEVEAVEEVAEEAVDLAKETAEEVAKEADTLVKAVEKDVKK